MENTVIEEMSTETTTDKHTVAISNFEGPLDLLCHLIDKNKISPQICHWSLLDNNDYVFQLYDGFAPISYDGDIPV